MMHGIGTHRGVQVATSSRIAYSPIEDRVQANQAVEARVEHEGVENRVSENAQVERRVDIAA